MYGLRYAYIYFVLLFLFLSVFIFFIIVIKLNIMSTKFIDRAIIEQVFIANPQESIDILSQSTNNNIPILNVVKKESHNEI